MLVFSALCSTMLWFHVVNSISSLLAACTFSLFIESSSVGNPLYYLTVAFLVGSHHFHQHTSHTFCASSCHIKFQADLLSDLPVLGLHRTTIVSSWSFNLTVLDISFPNLPTDPMPIQSSSQYFIQWSCELLLFSITTVVPIHVITRYSYGMLVSYVVYLSFSSGSLISLAISS